jgi:hypothetical protein
VISGLTYKITSSVFKIADCLGVKLDNLYVLCGHIDHVLLVMHSQRNVVFPLCKYLGNTFPLPPTPSTLHRYTLHCCIISINKECCDCILYENGQQKIHWPLHICFVLYKCTLLVSFHDNGQFVQLLREKINMYFLTTFISFHLSFHQISYLQRNL